MKRMKKAELRKAITDGTIVAVVTAYKPQGAFVVDGKRATVVAVDQLRHVNSGARWDFAGHNVKDGIRVRYEDAGVQVVAQRDAAIAASREHADKMNERERLATNAAAALGGRVESIRNNKTFEPIDYRIVLTIEQATRAAGIPA